MDLELELFAGLAERARASRVLVKGLEENLSVQEFKAELARRFPQWGALDSCSVVIGTEYARGDARIACGQSIALLPPVSGG